MEWLVSLILKDILGFSPRNYSNQSPGDGGEWTMSLCGLLKGILAEVVAVTSMWNYSNNFSPFAVIQAHHAYWKAFCNNLVLLKCSPQEKVKPTLRGLTARETLVLGGLMTDSKGMIAQRESNGHFHLQTPVLGSELLVHVILPVAFKSAWKERLAIQKSTFDMIRTLWGSEIN